jgi:hypothetical protein
MWRVYLRCQAADKRCSYHVRRILHAQWRNISQRYERDGFVTQAFQKAIMQWRPDGAYVALVNIFDDLNRMGFDQRLLETRQTPLQFPAGWDGEGLSFQQVVQKRQALYQATRVRRGAQSR